MNFSTLCARHHSTEWVVGILAVEGATANELDNPVPEEVKEARWHQFMAVQQEISAERLQRKIGAHMDIIVDEVSSDGAVGQQR